MKTWTLPVAVASKFAANDYVSACTATINCDLPLGTDPDGNPYIDYYIEFGKTIPTIAGDLSRCVYTPCGEEHDVNAYGELLEITITHGRIMKNGNKTRVELPEPINCFHWAEYDEDGVMVDGHCTLTRDGFQSNKS